MKKDYEMIWTGDIMEDCKVYPININTNDELMSRLKTFVEQTQLLPSYDTIITTPSENVQSQKISQHLRNLVPHSVCIEHYFECFLAQDVYDNVIDEDLIDAQKDSKKIYNSIDEAFSSMGMFNSGIFSYRCLKNIPYEEIIKRSIKSKIIVDKDLNFDEEINGKDVLVIDEVHQQDKQVSASGKAIYSMYAPRSLTFVTITCR